MKSDLIEFLENARKRKVGKLKHKLSVFLICLGISLFLWFLVRLSKDYPNTIPYQLKYTDIPYGFRLTGYSDSTLYMNLRMQGYEYFSEKYFKPQSRLLQIDLHRIRTRPSEDNIRGYLLTKSLVKSIAEQTGYPTENFSVYPDTLYFTFERKNTLKKIAPGNSRSIEISGHLDTIVPLKDTMLRNRLIKSSATPKSTRK
ncbi:MAG TPA: hypothetical protein VLR52_00640 [Bacteroidales bacterium]|nr:hypothetical protein [Bacteroidales bacterium]